MSSSAASSRRASLSTVAGQHHAHSQGFAAVDTPASTASFATVLCAMRNALHVVVNHVDSKGRFVAELFMTLVDRKIYPDYYKVISKPIALDTIQSRVENGTYGRLASPAAAMAAIEADFNLMVSNAMTFNQVGSEVCKDAKTLQTIFQSELTKELKNAEVDPKLVKYKTVINSIMAFTDDSERYVFDVFFELPDRKLYKDYYFSIKSPISLDMILTNIDAHKYKSPNDLVADIQLMVNNAKTYNVEGSQVYKDADRLMTFFQSRLEKYVINGESIANLSSEAADNSPAKVETVKMPLEEGEKIESVTVGGEVYYAGDCVRIVNPADESKPTIGQIMSIYKHTVYNKPYFTAAWFLRPEQTYQLATSKFMENEVLKTNHLESYDVQDIVGRCWVLFVKDYLKGKPKGADMKYVFPCESRYTFDGKSTSKIKLWQSKFPEPELEPHPVPLVPVRIPMFKEELSVPPADAKKRKSEDLGEFLEISQTPEVAHQDKKLKSHSSKPAVTPSAFPPNPPVSSSSSSRRDRNSMPSLNQQVASLVLPGGTSGKFDGSSKTNDKGHQSASGSGAATPTMAEKHATSSTPQASSTDAAGALGPIFELFDRTPAGEVKWYAGLPVHVVKKETVMHSLKYRLVKLNEEKLDNVSGADVTNNSVDHDIRMDGGVEDYAESENLDKNLWGPLKRAFYGELFTALIDVDNN
ncbi:hypothetical protein HDU84_009549 [Entophlyctis sp. JEL0112]|nr:hypothetical protein HDU84_009549 [Entophlyctis sp. JEL0112]